MALARDLAGEAIATIPNGLIFVGALISTMPISILGERFGLKVSYLVGTSCGLIGGTLCLIAVYLQSFPILCVALLFQGTMAATTALLRFGVRSVSPPRYMSKAVSFVVAGAAVASPIGPQLAIVMKNVIPTYPYMGIYILIDAFILAMAFTCSMIRFPPAGQGKKAAAAAEPVKTVADGPEQSRTSIVLNFLKSKRFLSATIAGMVSYAVMVLQMAPAPLAILGAGFTFADQANVLMARELNQRISASHTLTINHFADVLGMFVPSLFTGFLIDRWGAMRMNIIGMIILVIATGILFGGKILIIFYIGEALIGVGWNFSYVAASSIILQGAKPGRELQTVQGVNDTAIQGLMAVIFLISAPLYRGIDWAPICAISMALMGLAAISMLAVTRLPLRGLRDDNVGLKGYERQPKDEEVAGGQDAVEMEVKEEQK